MGVRILQDKKDDYCCFYCSTTMWAFGPIMYSWEEAEEFLKWLPMDPRRYKDSNLEIKYSDFKREKEKEISK